MRVRVVGMTGEGNRRWLNWCFIECDVMSWWYWSYYWVWYRVVMCVVSIYCLWWVISLMQLCYVGVNCDTWMWRMSYPKYIMGTRVMLLVLSRVNMCDIYDILDIIYMYVSVGYIYVCECGWLYIWWVRRCLCVTWMIMLYYVFLYDKWCFDTRVYVMIICYM